MLTYIIYIIVLLYVIMLAYNNKRKFSFFSYYSLVSAKKSLIPYLKQVYHSMYVNSKLLFSKNFGCLSLYCCLLFIFS